MWDHVKNRFVSLRKCRGLLLSCFLAFGALNGEVFALEESSSPQEVESTPETSSGNQEKGLFFDILEIVSPKSKKYESAVVKVISPYEIRYTHPTGAGRALIGHLSSSTLEKVLPLVREQFGAKSFFSTFLPTLWIPRSFEIANEGPDPLGEVGENGTRKKAVPAPRGASHAEADALSSFDSTEQIRKSAMISLILLSAAAVLLLLMYLRFAFSAFKENMVVGFFALLIPPIGWILGVAISAELRKTFFLSVFLIMLLVGVGCYLNPFFQHEDMVFDRLAAYRFFFS